MMSSALSKKREKKNRTQTPTDFGMYLYMCRYICVVFQTSCPMQANTLNLIATAQFSHHLLLAFLPNLHLPGDRHNAGETNPENACKPRSTQCLVHATGRWFPWRLKSLVHHREDTALVEHGHVHHWTSWARLSSQTFGDGTIFIKAKDPKASSGSTNKAREVLPGSNHSTISPKQKGQDSKMSVNPSLPWSWLNE